jgi:tRNA (guanine37-N1)-methyltransferase
MLRIDFVTLFPEQVLGLLEHSIIKRACTSGKVSLAAVNPREFTEDKHRTVDDAPFGGGPGMVLKAEPVARAIDSLQPDEGAAIVFLEPTGERFSNTVALEFAKLTHIILVCGHYEGIDDRVRQRYGTHTISIGDFVLTGGELAAAVVADAVIRLLPGVLGEAQSLEIDSHVEGLLSAPQFTRPVVWRDMPVPEVLLSGDHGAIAKWRRKQALMLTRTRRPDLFARANLYKHDLDLL